MKVLVFLLLGCLAEGLKLDRIQKEVFSRHQILLEPQFNFSFADNDQFVDYQFILSLPPIHHHSSFKSSLDYGFYVRNRQNTIMEFCRSLSPLKSISRYGKTRLTGLFGYDTSKIVPYRDLSWKPLKRPLPANADDLSMDGYGLNGPMGALLNGSWPVELSSDVLRLLYNKSMSKHVFETAVSTDLFSSTSTVTLQGCEIDGDGVILDFTGHARFPLKTEYGPVYMAVYPPRILNETHYSIPKKMEQVQTFWFPGGRVDNVMSLNVATKTDLKLISVIARHDFETKHQGEVEVKSDDNIVGGTVVTKYYEKLLISTNKESFTIHVNDAEAEVRTVFKPIFLLDVPDRFNLTIGNRTISGMDDVKLDFRGEPLQKTIAPQKWYETDEAAAGAICAFIFACILLCCVCYSCNKKQ